MDETSPSLLDRLRRDADPRDWQRLVDLYQPWIQSWLRGQGTGEHDAADITQEVLATVTRELPNFDYDPQRGRFRSWLRTITVNRMRAFFKSRRNRPVAPGGPDFGQIVEQLSDPHSELTQTWDREHDMYLVRRGLEQIKDEFRENTWESFKRVTIEAQSPDDVATELGMTRNAVYIANSRVLARLKQELAGLCEPSG